MHLQIPPCGFDARPHLRFLLGGGKTNYLSKSRIYCQSLLMSNSSHSIWVATASQVAHLALYLSLFSFQINLMSLTTALRAKMLFGACKQMNMSLFKRSSSKRFRFLSFNIAIRLNQRSAQAHRAGCKLAPCAFSNVDSAGNIHRLRQQSQVSDNGSFALAYLRQ